MREIINFDKGWLFHRGDLTYTLPAAKGPVYTSAKAECMHIGPASRFYGSPYADDFSNDTHLCPDTWEAVDVPHDYVIRMAPREGENPALGHFPCENAWYRKYFHVADEDKGKRLTLLFEGVATHVTMWLNGSLLAHHFCGYTSFEVDISDYVLYEEQNLLAVYVETTGAEGWWYEGGGIYRHVKLVKTDTVSVDLWGVYAVPRKVADSHWEIPVVTTVRCDRSHEESVTVSARLSDADGKEVACGTTCVTVPARDTRDAHCTLPLTSPHLWDIDDPYLYTVEVLLTIGDTPVDTYVTRTGFRTYAFDPDCGFILNDRPLKIKGVCAHGDFGLTGKAVPDNVQRYKIEMLKEMGANGYRTAHYPHAEATMDALDELGFIVMDETRWFATSEEHLDELRMMVKRDRNRPSVFFWSIGNEEPHHQTDVGRRITERLADEVRKLDDTRAITTAINSDPLTATVCGAVDVIGVNYSLHKHDTLHKMYPDTPIIMSECCAVSTTRGWYGASDPVRQYIEAYDSEDTTKWFLGREITWKHIAARSWMLGGYQWSGFEHRGEAVYPRLCSQAGAIDLYLQKKDAFYQNQSHWIENRPILHLLPHWNFVGREGEPIRVVAYTNCASVALYLNGALVERKKTPPYVHAEWSVPYEAGEIRAVGYDKDGNEAITCTRVTSGPATRLVLTADNSVTHANGEDILLLTCTCLDKEGREVPTAAPFVRFHTNGLGCVIGTGSDIIDPIPPHIADRRMRAGRITVAVRVGTTAGILRVFAESEGLTTGTAALLLQ